MEKLELIKTRFMQRFKGLHSLRFHMSLILLATVGSGLLATRLMLGLGLKNMAVRYPLAVLSAYLIFFLLVKLWLKLVVSLPFSGQKNSSGSFNLLPDLSGSSSSGGTASGSGGGFRGGGGNFGGGGASGSFGDMDAVLAGSGAEMASSGVEAGGGVAEAAGGAAGDAVSSLDLDKAWLVFLALAAIAALVFGVGIYLIYQAPLILSEAAFQGILAGGLAHRARRLQSGDWMGSLFKATWVPLALTLLLALLAGFLIHHFFPGVTHLSELWKPR